MRPEDIRTPADFEQWRREHFAALEAECRTPTWERVLLWMVLVLLGLVLVSAVASMVVPAVRA